MRRIRRGRLLPMPEIINRKEARARGLTKFFTRKPCLRGHFERYTVGGCVECALANGRRPEIRAREALRKREMRALRSEENRQEEALKRREWDRGRVWHRSHVDNREREYKKKYKLEHPRSAEKRAEDNRKQTIRRTAAMRALRELGIEF